MFNAVSPAHVFKPNPFIAVIHNSSPNNASPENAALSPSQILILDWDKVYISIFGQKLNQFVTFLS
jgi:hypothetical protein